MTRRSQSDSPAVPQDAASSAKAGGKGRPTPTRKEAEAAARARAKVPRTRKEIAAANRRARQESTASVREAMKSGDESKFMARDRGPVKRFVRDYVDSRFSLVELLLPVLVITLLMSFSGVTALINLSEIILLAVMIMLVMEMVFLRLKLRKELKARFPEESLKGATYYAIMRAMQMRFMRLPKPQVKLGDPLDRPYR